MFLKSYSPTCNVLKLIGGAQRRAFRTFLILTLLPAFTHIATADLSLSWTDNSNNETGFEIERSTDGTNFASLNTVGANATSYTDTTVIGGTTYWFRVRAYNGAGNSGYTNIASATAPTVNNVPTISSISNLEITQGDPNPVVNFTIGDVETDASSLSVQFISSNASLLQSSSIVLGGSGASRTATLSPETNQTGTTVVTITVSDGQDSASESFNFTVNPQAPANTSPTISSISNASIEPGQSFEIKAFTISDSETSSGSLSLTASSSNTALVPLSGLTLGGSGSNRTISVVPVANEEGSSTITIEVSDGELTAVESFSVTVSAPASGGGSSGGGSSGGGGGGGGGSGGGVVIPSDPPTISDISDVTANVGDKIEEIVFTVDDPDSSILSLSTSASSDNQSLVPDSGLSILGFWEEKKLRITPNKAASGSATITVAVQDSQNTVTTSFTLTIADSGEPKISLQPLNSAVREGDEAIFSVIATGAPELTYQWHFENKPIDGATEQLFGIESASAEDAGSYYVVISNAEGSVRSRSARLSIEQGIQIVSAPAITPNPEEGTVTISVEAAGPDLEYRWYRGEPGDTSSLVMGANGNTFTSSRLSADENYWVRVTTRTGGILLEAGDSINSPAATVAYGGGYGYYFGQIDGSLSGDFGLTIKHDRSVVFMARIDGSGLQDDDIVIFEETTLDSSDSFKINIPDVGQARGTVRDGILEGTIGGSLGKFSSNVASHSGSTSRNQGFYKANFVYADKGEMNLIVGPEGEGFAIIDDGQTLRGEIAIVGSDGDVSTALDEKLLVEAVVGEGPEISAQLTEVDTGASRRLKGVSDNVEAKRDLVNTSIRTTLKEGASRMISGFVVSGEPGETKQVLIRGIGPQLGEFGVGGTLEDPKIELYRLFWDGSSELIAENDDWDEADNSVEVSQKSASIGAFPLKSGGKDAVLLVDLPVGVYSAHVLGVNNGMGAAMVEIYDGDTLEESGSSSELANISIRGDAGVGAETIITGFVVNGNTPKRVLVRAVGSELSDFGVPGVLDDPKLTLYRAAWDGTSEAVGGNDDWEASDVVSEVSQQVGAFPIKADSKSAAMVIWLEPGVYTVHASSATAGSGAVLVEVYDAPTE